MKKEVKIRAQGAAYAPLDEFVWFQGELKVLSEQNYEKLKYQILELGFSEPVSVWIDGNDLKLLNGHQRILTLKKMRDEGYRIPHVPYSVVEAENEEQARRKVLSLTSHFGKITESGLAQFIHDTSISVEELFDFALPDVNLDNLPDIKESTVSEHIRVTIEDQSSPPELKKEFILTVEFDNENDLKNIYEELVQRGLKCRMIV